MRMHAYTSVNLRARHLLTVLSFILHSFSVQLRNTLIMPINEKSRKIHPITYRDRHKINDREQHWIKVVFFVKNDRILRYLYFLSSLRIHCNGSNNGTVHTKIKSR